MPKWSFKPTSGMVTDVPTGKQPEGTSASILNMVYNKERGGLVVDYGTESTGITAVSSVTSVTALLAESVNYPSKTDLLVLCSDQGIHQYNYWHNSSSVTAGWVKWTENITLTTLLGATLTINGSTTNTFVFTNADSLSLSQTANYYKNWCFAVTGAGSITTSFLVKTYSYSSASSGTSTFTLDSVIDPATSLTYDKATIDSIKAYRYFHTGTTVATDQTGFFAPSFTDPASYSDDRAMRFSGGQGSTVGYKNVKSGYVNKNLFANSGTAYQYTSTAVEQAECKAPLGLLNTLSVTDANTNLISSANDYDFSGSSTNWAKLGGTNTTDVSLATATVEYGTQVVKSPNGKNVEIIPAGTVTVSGLRIKAIGDGSASDCAQLTNTYTTNLTAAEYKLKIKGIVLNKSGQSLPAKLNARVDNSTTYTSTPMIFPASQDGQVFEQIFTFTSAITTKPNIEIWLTDVGNGFADEIMLTAVTLTASANSYQELNPNTTYKVFATYNYDIGQESEPVFLGSKFVTGKYAQLSTKISIRLGDLNPFINAVNLYMSAEPGDTTKLNTTTQPRYLVSEIPIEDSSTSSWSFSTGTGKYDYTDTMDGGDWETAQKNYSWEQATGRTESNSTTCSYNKAISVDGRKFLINDYDYADARSYSNRIRYTGFSGYGLPQPDIFPNILDSYITVITSGQSNDIRNIISDQHSILVLKKNSVVLFDISNPDPLFWNDRLIRNNVGTYSKYAAVKTDRGVYFSDLNGIYRYNGINIDDITKGIWKYNTYKSRVTSTTIAGSQRMFVIGVDNSINLVYDTNTSGASVKYFKWTDDDFTPVELNLSSTYILNALATISDGTVYFAIADGSIRDFKNGYGAETKTISLDTGYRDVELGKLIRPKNVYGIIESGLSASTFTLALVADGTTIATRTITPTTAGLQRYKFTVDSVKGAKQTKMTVAQTGTVNTNVSQFRVSELGFEYDMDDEFGDTIV